MQSFRLYMLDALTASISRLAHTLGPAACSAFDFAGTKYHTAEQKFE